ncbi:MAG: hypothetical protein ACOC1X_02930, partial [Promethearchaeota archaeon]
MQNYRNNDRLLVGAIISEIHKWLNFNKMLVYSIKINEKPSSDNKVQENIKKLSKIKYLKFDMWFSNEIGDGVVEFEEDKLNKKKTMINKIKYSPLEVGYTSIETLFYHITRFGTFSRWPYGSKFIYIFDLKEKLFNK